jgi:hypothetical protein
MKLPNRAKAYIDVRKLTDYCLSETHPRGQHKAAVFRWKLGITAANADALCDALAQAALTNEAEIGLSDEHGTRYTIEFELKTSTGSAIVRSGWIIHRDEDFPRFVSAYVK